MKPTDAQLVDIMRLRAIGYGWMRACDAVGVSQWLARDQLDPGYRARRNAVAAKRRDARKKVLPRVTPAPKKKRTPCYGATGHWVRDGHRGHVPNEVLDDRTARQMTQYQSLTSEFCGDPKPGYSALDRRR